MVDIWRALSVSRWERRTGDRSYPDGRRRCRSFSNAQEPVPGAGGKYPSPLVRCLPSPGRMENRCHGKMPFLFQMFDQMTCHPEVGVLAEVSGSGPTRRGKLSLPAPIGFRRRGLGKEPTDDREIIHGHRGLRISKREDIRRCPVKKEPMSDLISAYRGSSPREKPLRGPAHAFS